MLSDDLGFACELCGEVFEGIAACVPFSQCRCGGILREIEPGDVDDDDDEPGGYRLDDDYDEIWDDDEPGGYRLDDDYDEIWDDDGACDF